ncbi:MAG: hypothetical protein WCF77_03465 [Minisyncoccia bacterium]|jgi:hypothetical protein
MNKKNTIIIVVIIAVVLVVAAVFALGNHANAPQAAPQAQSQAAQAGPSGQAQQPGQPASVPAGFYTSSEDGFSVNFSGTPLVSKTTFNSPTAGSIPLTKYIAQAGSGSSAKYYVIYVYHYPQSYQFPNSYLSDALRLFAAAVNMKYPGTRLVSQTPTQFLNVSAMAGALTVPIGGAQTPGYLLITTKGQNTYGMGTYGASQSDYNAFVNSFTFTK